MIRIVGRETSSTVSQAPSHCRDQWEDVIRAVVGKPSFVHCLAWLFSQEYLSQS